MAESATVTFHVPEDPEFLAAVARVTICHAHLDYCLRVYIKSLAGLSVEEALDATEYEGSRVLRDRVRKLARMRLGEGRPLLRIQALMKRCEALSAERNRLTHDIIAVAHHTGLSIPLRRLSDHSWETLPDAKDLNTLAIGLTTLANELNQARLSGWLAEALQKRLLPG